MLGEVRGGARWRWPVPPRPPPTTCSGCCSICGGCRARGYTRYHLRSVDKGILGRSVLPSIYLAPPVAVPPVDIRNLLSHACHFSLYLLIFDFRYLDSHTLTPRTECETPRSQDQTHDHCARKPLSKRARHHESNTRGPAADQPAPRHTPRPTQHSPHPRRAAPRDLRQRLHVQVHRG